MINVNQITSRLAAMPDQALQQYAALHKNDPYTMSLALAESNRRKQIRQGQQMQAPQQPKVVDQEIAQMAAMPEETGIGILPAPNMQRMAEGGIVAFDGGGEVPGYFDGVYTGAGDIPDWVKRLPPESGVRMYYEKKARGEPLLTKPLWDTFEDYLKSPSAPAAAPAPSSPASPASTFGDMYKNPAVLNVPTAAAASSTPVSPAVPARPLAAAKPPGAPKVPAQGIATLPTDAATLKRDYEALQGEPPTTTPYDEKIKAISDASVAAQQEGLANLQSDIEKAGTAFTEREEKLKKRGEKLDAQEDKLPYMALIEAGLNIMAGTSPNAMTNIGAGATIGLKSYTAGIDKLTEARDKLDDAYGRIEEFRRNESMMNNKEIRAAKKDIKAAEIEGQKLGLSALQDYWKLKRDDASKVWTAMESNRRTVFEQQQENARTAQREAGATARANAALPQTLYTQLGAAAPDSALMRGYDLAKKEGERARMYDLYTKQASDMMKGPEFVAKYPTFKAYLQEFESSIDQNAPGGFLNKLPPNASVLPPKK